jgi:hypothetical protein
MAKLLEAFAGYGVTKEQIEKRIQRRIDSIQPAQVVALRKVYASLRDGMSAPTEWFDVDVPADAKPAAASAADALRAAAAAKTGKLTPPPVVAQANLTDTAR